MKNKRLIFIIIIVLFSFGHLLAEDGLKIHFIDIEEGDAILLESAGESVLIDAGSLLGGYRLTDYLLRNQIQALKYLIFTHYDLDHIAGAFFLLPKLKVREIFDNGQELDKNNDILRWYGMLVRSAPQYHVLKKGDKLSCGPAVVLEVLWPAKITGMDFNANCLVLKLTYNNFSCLFLADIAGHDEAEFLRANPGLRATMLKVGHHGYEGSASTRLLEKVRPRVAIITSGHPERYISVNLLDRLHKRGIKIFRIDKDGSIVVNVDNKGHYIVTNQREALQ